MRKISVGPFGNRVVYDPAQQTITRKYAFRKVAYSAVGTYVQVDVYNTNRGNTTVTLTITSADLSVVQCSTTGRGATIRAMVNSAHKLSAAVNAANVQRASVSAV